MGFVELLGPASGLVGEETTDRAGVSDSAVGWLKFLGVMGVPPHFGFGCKTREKFGLVEVMEEGRHIGVDGV